MKLGVLGLSLILAFSIANQNNTAANEESKPAAKETQKEGVKKERLAENESKETQSQKPQQKQEEEEIVIDLVDYSAY